MAGFTPSCEIIASNEYIVSYKNKQEVVTVITPNKDDTKELFTWAAQQVGMIVP